MFLLLLLLFAEAGHGGEEEPEFAGGGEGLSVLLRVGLGLGEGVDLVEQPVASDGVQDVAAVKLEVTQIGGGSGTGAAELVGDLLEGKSPAAEVVGFEDALAAPGVGGGVVVAV